MRSIGIEAPRPTEPRRGEGHPARDLNLQSQCGIAEIGLLVSVIWSGSSFPRPPLFEIVRSQEISVFAPSANIFDESLDTVSR